MPIKIPQVPGYLSGPIDPRTPFAHEIRTGGTIILPDHHQTKKAEFTPQGMWPFCTNMTATKLVQHFAEKNGLNVNLSRPFSFFRSGGSKNGAFMRAVLQDKLLNGDQTAARVPMPQNLWSLDEWEIQAKNAQMAIPDAKLKIANFIQVNPAPEEIARAILDYGKVGVVVAGNGNYWSDDTQFIKGSAYNHITTLDGFDLGGRFHCDESLQPSQSFDGRKTFAWDYPFQAVYAVTKLQDDWRDVRDKARAEPYQNALAHYGKPRDFLKEKQAEQELLVELKALNNRSVWDAAGQFWAVLINARAYGGYSVTYWKWARKMPGDLINFLYEYRRTGKYLFDLNLNRTV